VNSFRVLNFPDLIESKLRSGRPKDLLDVQELKRRKGFIRMLLSQRVVNDF
jgi:hypothetical protein